MGLPQAQHKPTLHSLTVRDSSDILAPARYSGKPGGFGRNAQKIFVIHIILFIFVGQETII